MKISVSVNNEVRCCDGSVALGDLLGAWGFACERVAVAVNEEFVPRSRYAEQRLNDGDRVDVLAPVQGG